MNGILVVDKHKGYTSRDVVNIVSKKLGIKKNRPHWDIRPYCNRGIGFMYWQMF